MSTQFDISQPTGSARRGLFLRCTRLAFVGSVAALLVAACGGGGSYDTPASNPPGAAATNYALGPVSGFGSVIVGGVRFDDSQASVSDEDGNSLSNSAVKLGAMLQVDASNMDASAGTAKAERLRLGSEIVGPVSAVDKTAGSVQLLGQTVLVTANTVFDNSLPGGLSALTVGTVIEVHGIANATTGQISATRIEPKPAALTYLLRGTVSALDTVAKTFKIGSALISYATTEAANLAPGLANSLTVRVRLQTAQVGGAWVAVAVRAGKREPGAGQGAHVEGVVTAFTSSSVFEVNGLKVDASGAAFPDGVAGVVLGTRVEVTGTVTNGVLVAVKVEMEGKRGDGKKGLELHGTMSALDTTAKTFLLRGVTVSYSGSVVFKDGTEANLANDKNVDVFGVLSADRTRLQAVRIEFKK
jgi:Domain of unknown function (DUF5666)